MLWILQGLVETRDQASWSDLSWEKGAGMNTETIGADGVRRNDKGISLESITIEAARTLKPGDMVSVFKGAYKSPCLYTVSSFPRESVVLCDPLGFSGPNVSVLLEGTNCHMPFYMINLAIGVGPGGEQDGVYHDGPISGMNVTCTVPSVGMQA